MGAIVISDSAAWVMWLFIKRIIQLVIISITTLGIAIIITLSLDTIFAVDPPKKDKPRKCTYTETGAIPYEVLIVLDGKYICGGTLIHEKYVLTLAQHVFDSSKENTYKKKMKVVVGTRSFPGGTSHDVEKITCHPSYDPQSFKDNIAVLQLTRDGSKFDYAAPISLPDGGKIYYEGVEILVSSFITLVIYPYPKYDQHSFPMLVVSSERCKETFGRDLKFLHMSGKFCAVTVSGYSSCRGVYGAPATLNGNYIIGIYMNYKNCPLDYPELFIDVAFYLDFIRTAMA